MASVLSFARLIGVDASGNPCDDGGAGGGACLLLLDFLGPLLDDFLVPLLLDFFFVGAFAMGSVCILLFMVDGSAKRPLVSPSPTACAGEDGPQPMMNDEWLCLLQYC
jgi:hypothetical protein